MSDVFLEGDKIQGISGRLPQRSEVYDTHRSARKTPLNLTTHTTTVGLQAYECNT